MTENKQTIPCANCGILITKDKEHEYIIHRVGKTGVRAWYCIRCIGNNNCE